MVRKKGSVLSLKIRRLVLSSTPSSFSSARALIMASPSSVASFLIICCPVSVCSLLVRSQPTVKNFPTSTTWNRVFCLGIRNVHSRKPVSSSLCGRDLAVDCGGCVLALFLPATISCENLHCCPLKQPFDVPKYGHSSR